jgi:CubicO group peptidase (beta-lactamase class C family)
MISKLVKANKLYRTIPRGYEMSSQSRRAFIVISGSALAAPFCWRSAASGDTGPTFITRSTKLEKLIERERGTIREIMNKDSVEGIAVCLVHEGEPVWVEGFGVTDHSSGRAVDTDTIFSIQSTSKNITAAAVMIAVERGLLNLDAPITTYLPDFTVHSRFEARPQEKITLRLLLSHRAGFTHEAPVGNNYDPSFPNFEAHVRSISDTWLRFPVGERYRYSNLGFDLAGYILEVRTGMPFAELISKAVFEPLGMRDSTVSSEVYAGLDNRALGHEKGHSSVPLITPLIPSGGVYTSARDMAVYAMFHLGRGTIHGRKVLHESLWTEMHGFALGGDYSLGVIRSEERYGATPIRVYSHQGGGFGFGSVFYYCPEARLAWAAFFNRPADACYGLGRELLSAELTNRFGPRKPRLAPDDLAPIDLTSSQLENFVGDYVGRNSIANIAKQGNKLVKVENSTSCMMRFTSPTDAYIAKSNGDTTAYEYFPSHSAEPAHFECWVGEASLDLNSGPQIPPGPDIGEWAQYLGDYVINQWGVPALRVTIQQRNGYLWINNMRMVVGPEIGLFFTSDGEAVDFRSTQPTWKNLKLLRVE